MQSNCKDFIGYVLTSPAKGLLSESAPLATQLAVMLMMHKNNGLLVENTVADLNKNFTKILSIVVENQLNLPEEDVEVCEAIKAITEEGEGGAPAGSSAPTNVTAGIEPTTPRIKPKKVKDELPE